MYQSTSTCALFEHPRCLDKDSVTGLLRWLIGKELSSDRLCSPDTIETCLFDNIGCPPKNWHHSKYEHPSNHTSQANETNQASCWITKHPPTKTRTRHSKRCGSYNWFHKASEIFTLRITCEKTHDKKSAVQLLPNTMQHVVSNILQRLNADLSQQESIRKMDRACQW